MQEIDFLYHMQYLQTIEHDFLSAGISISNQQLQELITFQHHVCKKLDWIELSPTKLGVIIQPFIACPYLPLDKYMMVLKKVISYYYHLRKTFDFHTSDEKIYMILYQEYYEYAGLRLHTLYASCHKLLMEEGGVIRHEPFDTLG